MSVNAVEDLVAGGAGAMVCCGCGPGAPAALAAALQRDDDAQMGTIDPG